MKTMDYSNNIYFTHKFKLTLMKNSNFSSKLLVNVGVQLGGHLQLLKLTTTSVVFGIRNSNVIINMNTTLIELKKVNRGIEGLGYGRATLYFINSTLSMATLFRKNFNYYNKHLFFPFRQNIIEIFDDFGFLKIDRQFKKNYCKTFGKKRFFLYKSGKYLLRKLFVSSKWQYGFVSNSETFGKFVDNVLHEKIKIGKVLNVYEQKIRLITDFYPFIPHYGFISDHRTNYWIVNEFIKSKVGNCSIIDTFTTKAFFSMYGIPGNACSIDTTFFFLSMAISNYLIGYNQRILKFLSSDYKLNYFQLSKKHIYFKKFKRHLRLFNN